MNEQTNEIRNQIAKCDTVCGIANVALVFKRGKLDLHKSKPVSFDLESTEQKTPQNNNNRAKYGCKWKMG